MSPSPLSVPFGKRIDVSTADLRSRCASLERGGTLMCPASYIVWAPAPDGRYRRLHALSAEELLPGGHDGGS
jgi:hypothetical protein